MATVKLTLVIETDLPVGEMTLGDLVQSICQVPAVKEYTGYGEHHFSSSTEGMKFSGVLEKSQHMTLKSHMIEIE